MNDAAVRVERRRDHAEPPEQVVRAEAVGEGIEVLHAVQERQNGRSRTDGFGEGRHRAVEIVGLAAEQHEVERVLEPIFRDRRRRRQVEVADAALDRQAVLRQRRRAARTDEKRDVPARLQQPPAEIAADCPGADNENLHRVRPFMAGRSLRGAERRVSPSAPALLRPSGCAFRF